MTLCSELATQGKNRSYVSRQVEDVHVCISIILFDH
jgi:hypothetical protein